MPALGRTRSAVRQQYLPLALVGLITLVCASSATALLFFNQPMRETRRLPALFLDGATPTPGYLIAPPTLVVSAMPITNTVSDNHLLWIANMETGDLSQWYLPDVIGGRDTGGGTYNQGSGRVNVIDTLAHSGRYSAQLTVEDGKSTAQAVRLFRWRENPTEAYYTVWFFFPQAYQPTKYWNVMQFQDPQGTFWVLNVGNRPNKEMYFYLFDWHNSKSYEQSFFNIPVGRWVQIEVYYRRANNNNGRLIVWQDRILLFDLDNVQTALSDQIQVSINNYTDSISPSPATLYVDDISITTERIK